MTQLRGLAALTIALAAPLRAQQLPVQTADAFAMLRVELAEDGAKLAELRRLGLDVPYIASDGDWASVLAPAAELPALRRAGFDFQVVSRDMAADYEARLAASPQVHGGDYGQWLSPPFGQGGMGGYYPYDELVSVLDQLKAAYPSLITARTSLGSSIEGRELWMVKISDNPDIDENEPEVRIDSLHHAREPEGMQASLWFMLSLLEGYGTDPIATYLVDERELYFVPIVNPDGYVYNQQTNPGGGGMWRKNRRANADGTTGVDLNRNYPYEWGFDDLGSSSSGGSEVYRGAGPASEPETAAMVAFIDSRDFQTALSVHTYSNLWLAPWGYDELYPANDADYDEIGALATEVNRYPYGAAWEILYAANGVTFDYDHGVHGTMCWTPEIGAPSDGFWPLQSRIVPLAEENRLAMARTAWAAGPFVRLLDTQVSELGDGDGSFEPGEGVELVLELRNSGRLTTGGAVELTLSSTSSELTVTQGLSTLAPLASFSEADNSATPLAFQIGAGALSGAELTYTLTLQHDGTSRDIEMSLAIGEARLFIVDSIELDLGWTLGVPGDGATTGLWEQGDPIGTDWNGLPMNPEDDASPGNGHQCFMTGNGGGSSGNDDVDGGPTTLVSPPFDLSQVASPRVGYQRWYAVSSNDDQLEVEISNDAGQTWVPLETVDALANEWTEVDFRVEDYLPPSADMRVRWRASDSPNNSLVEAAVDEFRVTIFDAVPRLNVYGSAALGTPVEWNVSAEVGDFVEVYASREPGNTTLPGVSGTLLLNPNMMFRIAQGSMPGEGPFHFSRTLPGNPVLIGVPFYFQAIVTGSAGPILTNRDELVFE